MKTLVNAIMSVIMILVVGSASAYQVRVTPDKSSTMVLDRSNKAVARQSESGVGFRAEMHAKPFVGPKDIAVATNYRVNMIAIYPDVTNDGMGNEISVIFHTDIKNNNTNNKGCVNIFDTSVPKWINLGQWCNVEKADHELKLIVGKSYRVETTAQSRIDANNINSTVVEITWTLPDEGYYTNVGKAYATVCPTEDDDNGHGNDPGNVDPSNPGKGGGKK